MLKDKENNYRLLNVLYTHLAVILQFYNVYFLTNVVKNEFSLEHEAFCYLDEARFYVIIVHALTFFLITAAVLFKHFKPARYLDMSLTWNSWSVLAGKLALAALIFLMMKASCGFASPCDNKQCLDLWVKGMGYSLLPDICLHAVVLVDIYRGWKKICPCFVRNNAVGVMPQAWQANTQQGMLLCKCQNILEN